MSYIIEFLWLLEYQEIVMSIEKSLKKERKEKERAKKRKGYQVWKQKIRRWRF